MTAVGRRMPAMPPIRYLLSLLPFLVAGLLAAQQVAPRPVIIDAGAHPNLQAAFDALPESGGIVRIPPGEYRLREPLRLKTAETRIEGCGAATHLINENTDGQPALILRPATLDTDNKARLWRVQLADFRISGQEKSGAGVFAEGIQEIYFEGMSVDHHGGHGIHMVDCSEDPRVADCILTYNKGAGVHIHGGHDIVVNACHFEENLDALHCVDSFNLCMNGNNVDDHLRHGVVIENTYGSVLSGNMIEECSGTAVILDRDCYGITLSANVIAHHLGGGIDLRDAHGCAVSANTFTIAHRFSVRVGGDSGRLSITGNSFCNTWVGGADRRPAEAKTPMGTDEGTGVLLEKGASHVSLTGNSYSGLSGPAVWSTGPCRGVLVSANSLTDCGRKLPAGAAWIDLPDASASLVRDNLEDRKR